MPKLTKLFTLLIVLSFFIFPPSYAQAAPGTLVWSGNCIDTNGIATLQGLECIYRNLLRIILPLGGLGAFLVVLIGGFQYITSAGDPKQAQKATATITGGVIGIVVAVGIWFLFQILNAVIGLDFLQFEIPGP